jgi:threonylcarbamoyladenosine tRNA methylthiotransferase MtaB
LFIGYHGDVTTQTLVLKEGNARPLTPAPTVAVLTIGCKLNQAESESLALELTAAGCHVTDRIGAADAFIINSCAVTHVAERKSRHLVRLARRLSPQARIVVSGCYAESDKANVLRELGADVVLGNDEKTRAARLLREADFSREVSIGSRLRTRSFVKIQSGCNDVCAFCIVPQTRGRERSVPMSEVLDCVARAEADGVHEVVLTGTQLGAYGRDQDEGVDLTGLLERLLQRTSIPRIRLSSVQPQDITPRLLELWGDGRVCRHFHLALQSGSDEVLARMRRRYTTGQFGEALDMVRTRLLDVAITTDVLVGFPGETEAAFAATERFCREAGFAAMHVFPFSARPGTLAGKMPDQVKAATKRARVQAMLAAGEELRDSFLRRFEGTVADVLFERPTRGNDWEGLTDNYIRVVVSSDEALDNRITAVRLGRRERNDLRGRLVTEMS